MIDEVAERGFAATTATRVYRRAGVSSRAFYENFESVHACFLAAYDASVEMAAAALRAAGSPSDDVPADPLRRFEAVLEVYLKLLEAERSVAHTFLIDVYAAGDEALTRRVTVNDQFVRAAQVTLAGGRQLGDEDRFAIEALVAAITFKVTTEIIRGDLGDIEALRAKLIGLAVRLCPWLAKDT